MNIITPCITFDQPLWWKAVGIIEAKQMGIVCKLGGFHTLMSFLGSIGRVMAGSGLEEALTEIYAKNHVPHIMSGKAVSRALRGHFLVEAALVKRLAQPIYADMELGYQTEIKILLERILNKDANVEDVNQSHALQLFSSTLKSSKDLLETQSRTAKLWIQYLNYIQIVKLFIHAERTGNWNLHLLATESMINLFAATGHLHYAKSARLYLQLMLALPEQYLWLYNKFAMEGYHTIRRSRRYWAGLWSDLVIEQVMIITISKFTSLQLDELWIELGRGKK